MLLIRPFIVVLVCILALPLRGFTDDTFRFAVFSDSRDDWKSESCSAGNGGVSPVLPIIVQDILYQNASSPIQLLMFPGDLMSGMLQRDADSVAACNRVMLKRWMAVMEPLLSAGMILRVTAGNHDVQVIENPKEQPRCGKHARLYESNPLQFEVLREAVPEMKDIRPGPVSDFGFTYSFDMGGCHFAVLNAYTLTENNSFSRETLDWLDKDLEQAGAAGVKNCFVASHPPAFPGGGHLWDSLSFYDPSYDCQGHQARVGIDHRTQRDAFWNILKKHRVVAYFCGHEHNIQVQEVEGVWHVVSGAITPKLYPLNGSPEDLNPNSTLYDGAFQNPRASENWPWNDTQKTYWGWCLVSVQGERVVMDVLGSATSPKDRSDLKLLKRFVLRDGPATR
jgi:hypothetical protein